MMITPILVTTMLILAVDNAEYTVSTPQEFWNAIGSDRTIIVEEGAIVLSDLLQYQDSANSGTNVQWSESGFGSSLCITGASDLTIRGASAFGCSLLTEESHAWVLSIFDCSRIRLENLVLGHIPSAACMEGVLAMSACSDVKVEGCELFGCGTVGLELSYVSEFTMSNSIIRDCGHGILHLVDSDTLSFTGSEFRDNDCLFGVWLDGRYGCRNVSFSSCLFENNEISRFEQGFFKSNGSNILLEDCIITENMYTQLYSPQCSLIVVDTEIVNNILFD